jgi:catechol 2,3-dioxygenase-like lactoylglutathione lyase family enzyme
MIKGCEHVGISVASLDRSIAFYRDVLGMELLIEAPFGGERYETILGLRGAGGKVALLRLGDFQVELFEFASPPPRSVDPNRPVCDHGITHFCLRVTDIDAEYARLKAAGVAFHCPPQDFAGALATYGRDPDGNVFELLEAASTAHGGDAGGRPK